MPPSPPVSRAGRTLDLVALVLALAGGVAWFVSYVGLERLRSAPEVTFSRGMSIDQLSRYQQLANLSLWGRGAIAAGVVLAVASWYLERRKRRLRS